MQTSTCLQPRDARDIADAIASANTTGESVELCGGRSKSEIGYREEATRRMDLSALSAIVDYRPSELVLTAEAGMKLGEIEQLVAMHHQMLAFEPMDYGPINGTDPGKATLGGVIAANASGPRRLSAGAARDHFLGFSGVSGRGEVFKAGGRVVKNVTGFDLAKLMAGSWGSLAALTEITVKVMPLPPDAITVLIAGQTEGESASTMSRAMGSPADVSGAAYLPRGIAAQMPVTTISAMHTSVTALRLEGFEPSVASRKEMLKSLFAEFEIALLDAQETRCFWRSVRDAIFFAQDHRSLWRICAPPMDGWRVAGALRDLEPNWFADWAGGLVWLAIPFDPEQDPCARVHDAVRAVHGHAKLMRAPAALYKAVATFSSQPPALAMLSRRIKEAFDPHRILNPGRMTVP